ncbi:hypothetical protein PHMEG_00040392 [Phytophthora megakarya]|uniref:Uncharacterized protein n=1 Tax=Phytophthora megakarya TaxID=4795 RepID=A0A225UGA1_9STRA|nr:hypothetical protein PHMEG_00040392 [Phytophthora megakarya]
MALDPVLVPKAGSHAIKKLKVDFDNPPSTEAKEQTASPTTAEEFPSGKKKKAPAAAKQSRITTSAKPKKKAAPAKKKVTRAATAEAMDTGDEDEEDAELVAQLAVLKTELAEFVDFPVAEVADMAIKEAVLKLFKEAKGNGLVLARKAYPWQGQFLWYNPPEFPDVYLVHWRWWMTSRLAFFLWGLNVPLEGTNAQGARRRKKSDAVAGRNEFVSFMVETWGWYGTLHRSISYSSGGAVNMDAPDHLPTIKVP